MLLSAQAQTAGGPPALPAGNTGIAASFPNDANIQAHANVLFADGFENYTSVSQLTGSGNYNNVFHDVGLDSSMSFSGAKALRLRVPATSIEFGSGIEKPMFPEQDTLFMWVY